MPVYEYSCPACDLTFELRRPFSESGDEACCPRCQAPARKLLSLFSAFSKGSSGEPSSIAGAGSACGSCTSSSCSSCGVAS